MAPPSALFALLVVSAVAENVQTQFPGEGRELASPDKHWLLRWIPADQNANGEHALLLVKAETGVSREVLSFPRHVTVTWAPDGRHFAVTNYTGSTDAESLVYPVEFRAPQSVEALLEERQPGALSFTQGAGHRYVEVLRWLDAKTLSIRVWGYGGKRDFDKRFRLEVKE
jgi:hypothetical protein